MFPKWILADGVTKHGDWEATPVFATIEVAEQAAWFDEIGFVRATESFHSGYKCEFLLAAIIVA